MRLILATLIAAIATFSAPHMALADPVSIGGFLFTNTFLSSAFGLGTLITAAQTGLLLAGSVAVSLLGSRRSGGQSNDPGRYKSTFEASETSELNAIGRVRVSGLKAFGNTAGAFRHRMVLHSATPLIAVEEFYLGGRPVIVEENGAVSSPPYATPGGSWVYWFRKSANETITAWSTLVSSYPTIWTAAHRAQGISQSLIQYESPGITTEKFGKLYQGGEPSGEILGRWAHVYDPREPGIDINDESTWVWSMNGPLCAARIMLSYPNLTISDFDWDHISGEADRADVLVAKRSGTEPRSTCSGIWLSESKRGDTMQDVLRSIGAEISLSDAGLIRITLIDDVPSSEIVFSEDHITKWDWKSGPEAVERPNLCVIRYYSPERNYEMAEIDMSGIAWARIDDEITRYGEKPLEIDLPFCPSASQAQRIARRLFLQARADVGTITTNMAGMASWGLYYATIPFPDLNETPLCRILPPRCNDADGTVEIPFSVWPDAMINEPWSPATMEAWPPDAIPSLEFSGDVPTPAAPSEATIVQYADLSYEVRLRFAAVSGGTQAEAVCRDYTDDLPNAYAAMVEYEGTGGTWYAYRAEDLSGGRVDFRCRFFNADDDGSAFSPVATVNPLAIDNSTPDAPTLDVVVSGTLPTLTFDVTATTTDMNVVRIVITQDAVETADEVRPNGSVSDSYIESQQVADTTFTVTAVAYTSNGTPSAMATYNYLIPGSGGS